MMSAPGDKISRRQFVRLGALGAIAWSAAACSIYPQPTTEPAGTATKVGPPPSSTPLPATVAPARVVKLLRNEDREGFYIRYYRLFSAVDADQWRLDVSGLVERPHSFNIADVLAFPLVSMDARMKCVECWSARAKWGGFRYETLAGLVNPKPEAKWLRVDCADTYWEHVSIEEMKNERALFVTHMNGQLLPEEYGSPLRLILPWKYGYKNAKAITSIRFVAEGGPGYWSSAGPYTMDGDIEPGFDHPLDLPGKSRPISGGEITTY